MFMLKECNTNSQFDSEISEVFKKHFRKIVQHRSDLCYKDVIESTFSALGISHIGTPYQFLEDWFNRIYNQLFLKQFIKKNTEEIILHSPFDLQSTSNEGTSFECTEELHLYTDYELILETLCLKNSINWNTSSPFASFRATICDTDFRVTLTHKSTLSTPFHKAFFRVIKKQSFQLETFTEKFNLIRDMVKSKNNILISGATGSGKTSFIKSLLSNLKEKEHTILLEDTEELTQDFPHFTCMLSKNSEPYSLEKYCEYSMRMRPDRLILGEMRSKEVIPFILSMNNGHKGLMSTVHANSALDAIQRIGLLFEFFSISKSITYEQILKLICKDLDYVIHMENKKVTEIIKIIGYSNQQIRFEKIC